MRIAFYAPLKAPEHPVASGDREMARLLIETLRRRGHAVEVISQFRTFIPAPNGARQDELRVEVTGEIEGICAAWDGPGRGAPDLWFTYHNHHKAPDLLGPSLTRRFAMPYVLAEASHAPKRAADWGSWHAAAEAASRAADTHIHFTARDRSGLAALLGMSTPLIDLPPFIDAASWPEVRPRQRDGPIRLVTVAMMRPGDKLASYRLLAAALALLGDLKWHLTVIGDGPAREQVHESFGGLPLAQVTWRGSLTREALQAELAESEIYAWPGFGEAFGLAYLEAQVMGLPAVALDIAGVSSVVRSSVTGILVDDPAPAPYATALRRLIQDRTLRETLGSGAAAFVRNERTLDVVAEILDRALVTAQSRAMARGASPRRKLWQTLDDALHRCEAAGRTVEIWLRDDDARVVTPALERLAGLCGRYGMPVLLAVIPSGAERELETFIKRNSHMLPTQHGYAHVNHAAIGERPRELGGVRPVREVLEDLARGHRMLLDLFGEGLRRILVPPWNRIDDAIVDALPSAGCGALSTFADDERGRQGLLRLNSDLDIFDWRNRRGHGHAKLAVRLAALVERATAGTKPIGLLTHHLAHDATAWAFLEDGLARLSDHPAVRFARADHLLSHQR